MSPQCMRCRCIAAAFSKKRRLEFKTGKREISQIVSAILDDVNQYFSAEPGFSPQTGLTSIKILKKRPQSGGFGAT